jgi:hypothetical protein
MAMNRWQKKGYNTQKESMVYVRILTGKEGKGKDMIYRGGLWVLV